MRLAAKCRKEEQVMFGTHTVYESFRRPKTVTLGVSTIFESIFQTLSNIDFIGNKRKSQLNNISFDVSSRKLLEINLQI